MSVLELLKIWTITPQVGWCNARRVPHSPDSTIYPRYGVITWFCRTRLADIYYRAKSLRWCWQALSISRGTCNKSVIRILQRISIKLFVFITQALSMRQTCRMGRVQPTAMSVILRTDSRGAPTRSLRTFTLWPFWWSDVGVDVNSRSCSKFQAEIRSRGLYDRMIFICSAHFWGPSNTVARDIFTGWSSTEIYQWTGPMSILIKSLVPSVDQLKQRQTFMQIQGYPVPIHSRRYHLRSRVQVIHVWLIFHTVLWFASQTILLVSASKSTMLLSKTPHGIRIRSPVLPVTGQPTQHHESSAAWEVRSLNQTCFPSALVSEKTCRMLAILSCSSLWSQPLGMIETVEDWQTMITTLGTIVSRDRTLVWPYLEFRGRIDMLRSL